MLLVPLTRNDGNTILRIIRIGEVLVRIERKREVAGEDKDTSTNEYNIPCSNV